jgi:hypothetical protein
MSAAMVELSLIVFGANALIEGAITLSALRAIDRLKPGISILGALKTSSAVPKGKLRTMAVVIASISPVIAVVGLAIGSKLPDGLERLALRLGVPFAAHPIFHGPLSDYYVRGLGLNWARRTGWAIVYRRGL